MSAQPFGGPIVAPAAAKSLQDLLGSRIPSAQSFSHATLRAADTNTAKVWIGESDLTTTANQHGYLLAGESAVIRIGAAMHLDKVFLVGNGTDLVYVSGVCY